MDILSNLFGAVFFCFRYSPLEFAGTYTFVSIYFTLQFLLQVIIAANLKVILVDLTFI